MKKALLATLLLVFNASELLFLWSWFKPHIFALFVYAEPFLDYYTIRFTGGSLGEANVSPSEFQDISLLFLFSSFFILLTFLFRSRKKLPTQVAPLLILFAVFSPLVTRAQHPSLLFMAYLVGGIGVLVLLYTGIQVLIAWFVAWLERKNQAKIAVLVLLVPSLALLGFVFYTAINCGHSPAQQENCRQTLAATLRQGNLCSSLDDAGRVACEQEVEKQEKNSWSIMFPSRLRDCEATLAQEKVTCYDQLATESASDFNKFTYPCTTKHLLNSAMAEQELISCMKRFEKQPNQLDDYQRSCSRLGETQKEICSRF
ncbi:MAG: hypothetical protein AAB589_00530 [Patescibacteria group bacterium]